jgi:hypothetical protein
MVAGQRYGTQPDPTWAVRILMRISHIVAALAWAVACTSATSPLAASPSDVRVYPSSTETAITEGETVLAAEPDAVYRAVTDYPRWTTMFPNVRQVIITSQAGGHDRVTFVHPDGNRDNVHFHNVPAARMVWFEDTGGRAEVWVEILFLPGARPGTTRVHSRLYADVHGWASLFVTDGKLRSMREQRVREDLTHLRAYFGHDVAATVPDHTAAIDGGM